MLHDKNELMLIIAARYTVLLFARGMIGSGAVFWFAPLGFGETPGAALPDLLSIVVAAGSFA